MALVGVLVLAFVAFGYREQRGYLRHRYADPGFTTQGLDAAFKWANSLSGARIATTSTRQYPLFGTDLSNRVQYVGIERPHGGFTAPSTCQTWRRLLNAGNYDYVIATRDRIEARQARLPPNGPLDHRPKRRSRPAQAPHSGFPADGPSRPLVLPVIRSSGGWRRGSDGRDRRLRRARP